MAQKMASMRILYTISMLIVVLGPTAISADNLNIGVCYGMLGNNLPPATDVIALYKKYSIGKLRLFDPNPDALQALAWSNINVTLGVRNEDIPSIAASVDGARVWFEVNVLPYLATVYFPFISVGNEAIPGQFAGAIPQAMKNLQAVLDTHSLSLVAVTTTVSTAVLANTYPPSTTVFSDEARDVMTQVLQFLSVKGSPLMVNVYPYFAYKSDPVNVHLDYAQFTATAPVVKDGNLNYYNLFDAIVDGAYWAMEKQGISNVGVAVSESGWPSAGNGGFTTVDLAATYNKNFVNHILSGVGTPKRPGALAEGFVFAMFNENEKPGGEEQNWGLFYPNMQPVYPVFA